MWDGLKIPKLRYISDNVSLRSVHTGSWEREVTNLLKANQYTKLEGSSSGDPGHREAAILTMVSR